jgi:hypothetical protein
MEEYIAGPVLQLTTAFSPKPWRCDGHSYALAMFD